MKHEDLWQPSKFVRRGGRLVAGDSVSPGSRQFTGSLARCFEAHLHAHCSGRLVDLGCGRVPLFAEYRGLVREVVCADWPASAHGSDHVDVSCDLTAPLPFLDGEFDTVLLTDVLEHVPTPEALFAEIARILAPGGEVILTVPFYYPLHETPHDYYRYTAYALRRFVAQHGLDLVVLEPLGGVPEVLADLLAKQLADLGRVGRWLAVLLQRGVSWYVGTKPGRRASSRSARTFPLGYFLVARRAIPPSPPAADG